jgi:hypothetical protein
MTTLLKDDVRSGLPEALDQLPENQRKYIDATDVGGFEGKGLRIYEGTKGGTYVDATAAWLDEHKQKGHAVVEDKTSPFAGLVPHPEHGHNTYEFENGDVATDKEAPKGEDGKKLKKKKDKHGNDVIVDHAHTRNRGNQNIPPDAVDVHVALNPNLPWQAKWRHPQTGKIGTSYNHDFAKKKLAKGWEDFRTHRGDIRKGIRQLRNMSVDQLKESPTDTCLALVGLLGIRHGGAARTHDDGELTGMGAVDLRKQDVSIRGDGITLIYRGKWNRPQRFTKRSKAVAEAMAHHMAGKGDDDKVFATTPTRNSKRLKELSGNAKVKVKDLRTDYANYTAEDAVKANPPPPNMSSKGFTAWQNKIGLIVGEALGHKKEEVRKNKSGNIMYEANGETPKTRFVTTAKESIDSYIDPAFWDKHRPKQDIQNAYTPDWHDKTPKEKRDIDENAVDRKRKGENRQWGIREFGGQRKPLVKTWIQSLSEQGFAAPVIKQATAQQMWFLNNGIDYVGTFGLQGDVFVEKATFKPTFNKPGISFNPSGRNWDKKTKVENKDVETLNLDESDDF